MRLILMRWRPEHDIYDDDTDYDSKDQIATTVTFGSVSGYACTLPSLQESN